VAASHTLQAMLRKMKAYNTYFKLISINILLLLLLVNSCSKNPKCSGEDKNLGLIKSSFTIPCFPKTGQNTFIIDNDSNFTKTFTDTLIGYIPCDLPIIDFNSNTLLGLYAEGQCEVKFIRNVTLSNDECQYFYKINVNECGSCKKLDCSYNWVIVPKLPDGWTVVFETTNN